MIIIETIGNTKISAGEPSQNHVRLSPKSNTPLTPLNTVEISYADWQEIKKTIDQMFAILHRK